MQKERENPQYKKKLVTQEIYKICREHFISCGVLRLYAVTRSAITQLMLLKKSTKSAESTYKLWSAKVMCSDKISNKSTFGVKITSVKIFLASLVSETHGSENKQVSS